MKLRKKLSKRETPLRTVDATVIQEGANKEFDPRINITESDLDGIGQMITDWYDFENLDESAAIRFVDLMFELYTIRPEYVRRIMENTQIVEALKKSVEEWKRQLSQHRASYLPRLTRLISLFPNYKDDLNVDMDFDKFSSHKHSVKFELNRMNYRAILNLAEQIMMFYPQRKAELGLDEETYKTLLRNADYSRNFSMRDVELFSILAIAYPEHKGDFERFSEAIDYLKKDLQKMREGGRWEPLVRCAKKLSLFTADEIQTSPQGIQAIYHDVLPQAPQLPRRNLAA